MKQDNEKEAYEAWYAYLLESLEYKALCEWFRKKQKDPKLQWPKGKEPSMGLRLMYDFFGDVFKRGFQDWWKSKQVHFSPIGVIEYRKQQASHEFDAAIKYFMNSHDGRKPDLDELKAFFIERVFAHLPGSFILRVHLDPRLKTEDLKAQFSNLLIGKRELFEDWEESLGKGWNPQGERIAHPKKLKRYLVVYRLDAMGVKFEDIKAIINETDPEALREYLMETKRLKKSGIKFKKKDIEDIASILELHSDKGPYGNPQPTDLKYVEAILKNLAAGKFPGKYAAIKSKNKAKK